MTAPPAPALELAVIEPRRGWAPLELGELWRYRELVYFLVWRDIKVRYKQTALGAIWAVLPPLLTMAVFSLFFGRLGKMPSDGLPYPLFALAALVPWNFFSQGFTQAVNSVAGSANLIQKVYFPRLAIPLAATFAGVVDLMLGLGALAGMMAFYRIPFTLRIFWLPWLLLLVWTVALGVGLWLSALNVRYRDVRQIVPFLVQFWLFVTPIAYPSSLLSPSWRTLYGLNPMAGVVEGFRWALLGAPAPPLAMIVAASTAALGLLWGGARYYRSVERSFADVV